MENKTDLREELLRLSTIMKFSPKLLEKDYHLTRILRKLSKKKIKDLVFKGGTCLNKCYLGFYRLSEDLDFVCNKELGNLSKMQIKKLLDEIRRELFEILNDLGFKTDKELGKGWKMLTSKELKIAGLEIIANYTSFIDSSVQTIKLEVSFRKRLIKPTRIRIIKHEFVDALGKEMLKKDVEIEAIDLEENFAEKVRALVIRKNIAIRDVYDIYFILRRGFVKIDERMTGLILTKINESADIRFDEERLRNFIEGLISRIEDLNEKELLALLKSDEDVDVRRMIRVIVESFQM